MHLEDVILLFHEPACPGVITSTDEGKLICAECDQCVGQIDAAVLQALVETLSVFGVSIPRVRG